MPGYPWTIWWMSVSVSFHSRHTHGRMALMKFEFGKIPKLSSQAEQTGKHILPCNFLPCQFLMDFLQTFRTGLVFPSSSKWDVEVLIYNQNCTHMWMQRITHNHVWIMNTDTHIRDRSGLWQKKALKKVPFQGKKSTFLAKKTPISQKKHFWSRKKQLVNIILLTKSNKKVLTIKLFSLFFICVIKFLRARCQVLCE